MKRRALLPIALSLATNARAQDHAAKGGASVAQPSEPTEVIVRAVRRASPQGTSVRAREAAAQAGSLGDATRVVENMPGLSRGGPGAAIIAWGSSEQESAILLDGVPLPFLFHGSGVRGVVPSSSLSSVRVIPGAFGVEYGRATGGLVLLTSERLTEERVSLDAAVDLIDAGGQVSAGSAGLLGAVSFRQGILASWFPENTLSKSPFTIPDYRDGFARTHAQIDEDSSFSLNYIGSEDSSTRAVPSVDGDVFTDTRSRGFHRVYANYEREGGLSRVRITPFFGMNQDDRSAGVGLRGARSSVEEIVYGLRASDLYRLSGAATLSVGVDALGTASNIRREGTLTLPAREGDPYVLGVTPAADSAFDAYRTQVMDVGLFAELSFLWKDLSISPSLRVNMGFVETSAIRPVPGSIPPSGSTRPNLDLDPRLFLRYALSSEVVFFGGLGAYTKGPSPLDLSSVFGSPALGPMRAVHGTLGMSMNLHDTFEVEVQGFGKELSNLAVRPTSPTPRVAEALTSSGSGTVVGAQALLRLRPIEGWSGWVSWTISRSVRSQADGSARLFDFDQPLVATLVLARAVGPWVPSVRVRYASGSPRTPATGSFWNHTSGGYEPIYGPLNSTRLPSFFQVDVRLERSFPIGSHGRLTASVEALNITFQQNGEEFLYSPSFEEKGLFLGMPPLVNVGVRCEL